MESVAQRLAQPRNSLDHTLFSLVLTYLEDREVCLITQLDRRFNSLIDIELINGSYSLSIVFRLYHPIKNYSLNLFDFHNSPQKACEDILRSRIRSLFNQKLTISEEAVKETIAKLIDKDIFILASDEEYTESLLDLLKGMKKEETAGKYEVYSRIIKELTTLYEERKVTETQASTIKAENFKLLQISSKESTFEARALHNAAFNFCLLESRNLSDDTDLLEEDDDEVDL